MQNSSGLVLQSGSEYNLLYLYLVFTLVSHNLCPQAVFSSRFPTYLKIALIRYFIFLNICNYISAKKY